MEIREGRILKTATLKDGGVELSTYQGNVETGPVHFFKDEIPNVIESLLAALGVEEIWTEDIEDWIAERLKEQKSEEE